jgi:hypothetical protein
MYSWDLRLRKCGLLYAWHVPIVRALRLALKVRFRLGLNDVFATKVGECCVNVMHAISFIWHADKLSHEPRKHRSVGELEGGVYFRLPKYPLPTIRNCSECDMWTSLSRGRHKQSFVNFCADFSSVTQNLTFKRILGYSWWLYGLGRRLTVWLGTDISAENIAFVFRAEMEAACFIEGRAIAHAASRRPVWHLWWRKWLSDRFFS